MRLVTFQRRSRSMRAGVLLSDGRVLDLGRAYTKHYGEGHIPSAHDTAGLIDVLRGMSSSLLEVLRIGEEALTNCFELETRAARGEFAECTLPLADTPLVAPIPVPPLLMFFDTFESSATARLGMNASAGLPQAWYRYPGFFYGNPHAVQGTGATVRFPQQEERLDILPQIAVVLAEDVRDASLEDAEDAILGYTMVLGFAARGVEENLAALQVGPAKAACPALIVGPSIVTKDEIGAPYDLNVNVNINGRPRGNGNMSAMRFSFAEMISFASEGNSLPAGSIICSGPIGGCTGLETGEYLSPGDAMDFEIEQLGKLNGRIYEKLHPRIFRPRMDVPA